MADAASLPRNKCPERLHIQQRLRAFYRHRRDTAFGEMHVDIRRDSACLKTPRGTAASVRPDNYPMVLFKIGMSGRHAPINITAVSDDDVRAVVNRDSKHRRAAPRAQPVENAELCLV
jgi:hypothetical protein